MQQILPIFLIVFLAELGDKTQLATAMFAANKESHPVLVFLAALAALAISTALAVWLGSVALRTLPPESIKLTAGLGFILIGCWTLYESFRA
ncbi:MAG: TMEM165/GDT1 family protein [Kiloniellales bacterium]|nr:TMEM165/GDT1 family protein [Kiloniellales bacterium]